MKPLAALVFASLLIAGCGKDDDEPLLPQPDAGPKLVFRFAFDEDQPRLDNLGNPSELPAGHAAQTPRFNSISANYIELTPNALTALGMGEVVYVGQETSAGGEQAIDIAQAKFVGAGEDFFSIPLSQVSPGTYTYLRVSLSYQNYDIDFLASGFNLEGTIASFVGYNNYIGTYTIKNQEVEVNGNRLQGYWGFETVGQVVTGQAPPGATTVPNPIWSTSPVPAGSCVVTGAFPEPLTITGNENGDVVVTLSVSINDSFEWIDSTADGVFEPGAGETVVDMGVRGLIPMVN
jgi:hypothetical protein